MARLSSLVRKIDRLPALALAVYALILSTVLSFRSLWLDELLQLFGTRDSSFKRTVYFALINHGGVPLPYLFQKWTLDLLGYSLTTARLPAALFSVAAAAAFFVLCRQLDLPRPLLAMVIFIATPLQFRYGIEARGYSQGLFFAILSCNAFLALRAQARNSRWAWLYFTSVLFGLYAQPFSIFLPLAQSLWLFAEASGPDSRRMKVVVLTSVSIASVCFLPWLLVAHRVQIESIGPFTPIVASFAVAQINPRIVIREMSGGGFACSLTILTLAAIGLHNLRDRFSERLFLGLTALVPFFGALVADAVFNYFFAARQLIFALPAFAALAATGFVPSRRLLPALLLSIFFIGAVVKDAKQTFFSRDDWENTAFLVKSNLPADGCIITDPRHHIELFTFYQPTLQHRSCETTHPVTIMTVRTIYSTQIPVPGDYQRIRKIHTNFAELELFQRTQ